MKVPIRRLGNSLGILLPKATLDTWGLSEGDSLELSALGLRPPGRGGLRHTQLDELRRTMALAVIRCFTPAQIRAQILANLQRWKLRGVWVPAFDEWQEIARAGYDGRLFATMLGRDAEAVRLRQSAPYAGLLSYDEVRKLNEEAAR